MNNNPLIDFTRTVECSVKIPSNGKWYSPDTIKLNSIGEVDIKPMLPKDELLLTNPDTLLSGETTIRIIKSCCDGIERPEDLYYPDVNTLLLGIYKATYGNTINVNGQCPKCFEKKNSYYINLLNDKLIKYKKEKNISIENDIDKDIFDEISEKCINETNEHFKDMEKNNEINVSSQKSSQDIDYIFAKMTYLPNEKIIDFPNGLKLYIQPYKCKDKAFIAYKNIHGKRKLTNLLEEIKKVKDDDAESCEMIVNSLNDAYSEITKDSSEILSLGIIKIELPSGNIITEKEYIKEFLDNISTKYVKEISLEIEKLTSYGIPQTVDFECSACHYQWKELFHGYNQSDFFGIRS